MGAGDESVLIHKGSKLLRRTEKGGTSSASSAIGKTTDVWDSSLCSLAPENVNSGDVPRCGSTFFQYFVHHV